MCSGNTRRITTRLTPRMVPSTCRSEAGSRIGQSRTAPTSSARHSHMP
jgi:hypothetical protein